MIKVDQEVAEIIALILLCLTVISYYVRIKSKTYYTHVWKKTSALKPEDILGFYSKPLYGFNEYYLDRQSDETIKEIISVGKNVFITGKLLSGKSRAIYQALTTLEGKYDIMIPRMVDMKSFRIPWHFCFWRKKIVVLDDLDQFAKKQNFIYLFRKFVKRKIIIIASCRSDSVNGLCEKIDRETSVFDKHVEISNIAWEVGENIAGLTGRELPHGFDGSIGTIFVRLHEMGGVYRICSEQEKNILMAVRSLYMAGIYDEREIFSIDRLKQVCCKGFEADCSNYAWEEYFAALKDKGFIEVLKSEIWAVKYYLEYSMVDGMGNTDGIMTDDLSLIDNFHDLTGVFAGDFAALFSLGNQAYHVGINNMRKMQYMAIVITAYEEALKVKMPVTRSMDYATLQYNLAAAYSAMAEKDVDEEEKAENCRRSVKAYEEALRVKTHGRFPLDFAKIKYSLGNCYSILAIRDIKAANSKNAVKAYEGALKVYSFRRFPDEFAMTQNNLGYAFSLLAEVEDKIKNCKKAIKAFRKAHEVRSQKPQSVEYATTQCNMGAAFTALAEEEDKRENCLKAIEAHEKALKVFKKEEYPLEYAMTLTSIGHAYYTLAGAENQLDNCFKAIKAYEEAIEYRTPGIFPLEYAAILNNMGKAYCGLAEAEGKKEDKIKYFVKAINVYNDALNYRTIRSFPVDYAMTQNNLGTVYSMLAVLEYRSENCRKAIAAHGEALNVYSPGNLPFQYANTQVKLGNAYVTLAVAEEKAKNCYQAIKAYQEALEFYEREHYTIEYALTCNSMGDAYITLSEMEEKFENLKKAVWAYEEALKNTRVQLPMDYGFTWHKLGNAYSMIAELEDKAENLKKACQAYEEALKFYPIQSFGELYAAIQSKLGHNYNLLADLIDRAQNSKKAINAFREALRVYTRARFPMQFASTYNKLGNAYTTLAHVENSSENYNNAAKSYENALTVFTKEAFPEVYQVVDRNLYRVLTILENC